MKKIITFVITLLAIVTLSACGKNEKTKGDSYNKIEKSGKIVIGLDDTFAPMSYRNNREEIVGFDVDLAKAVAKKLNLKVEFQGIDWVMKETELNEGNIDLIWNGYTITEERQEKVAFSIPYLDNRQAIIVLKDSKIQTKKELKDKLVAVQQSSSAVDAVNSDKELATDQLKELLQYPSNNDVFNDLDAKRSDAAVVDEVLARYYIQLKGADKYRILADDFGKEQYGVGMRLADKKLKEKIDQAINELKADGSYDKIYQNWFGK